MAANVLTAAQLARGAPPPGAWAGARAAAAADLPDWAPRALTFWARCQAAAAAGASGAVFDALYRALERLAVVAQDCGAKPAAAAAGPTFSVDEVAAELIDAATWCIVNGRGEIAVLVFGFLEQAVVDPGALAATRALALCEAGQAELALAWLERQTEAVNEHEMVRAARLVARLDRGEAEVQRDCALLLATASDDAVRRLADWVQRRAQMQAA